MAATVAKGGEGAPDYSHKLIDGKKISAEVQEMCELFASLGSLVEAQAQPIETIQDAAHRAAEKTAAAVVELQTTAEKQGECLVQ